MPPEARLYEPTVALNGGGDGLRVLERVANEAPKWLAHKGNLLVETSTRQAWTAVGILAEAGLSAGMATSIEHEATVVIGTSSQPRIC